MLLIQEIFEVSCEFLGGDVEANGLKCGRRVSVSKVFHPLSGDGVGE